ncbi:MAG: DNA-formamidopyrimidine glycosylase family protein [Chthoniobacterales bacterium]
MPELAEVDHARKLWDVGVGAKVLEVIVPKPAVRVLRGTDVDALTAGLTGRVLAESEASGKQMVFRFGAKRDRWLGVHLGMRGRLRVEPEDAELEKHDYLALRQRGRMLVFNDARVFGRLLYHEGVDAPEWWAKLPPSIFSAAFSREAVGAFLERRKRTPLKPLLLMQERFPGVGNWMADEILWRARLHPRRLAGGMSTKEIGALWRTVRDVCVKSVEQIDDDWQYPRTWLFPHRWTDGGTCPRCRGGLERAVIGGRRTCWCPGCQGVGGVEC